MEIAFIVITFYLALMLVIGLVHRRRSQGGQEAPPPAPQPGPLDALAERLGVRCEGDTVRVRRGEHEAVVQRQERAVSDGAPSLYMVVRFTGPIAQLTLVPEGMRASRDLQTGDPGFDGLARIGGDPALALAVLDPGTRSLASRLLMAGWKLQDGTLQFEQFGGQTDEIPLRIEEGFTLARALRPPAELGAALVERLAGEPSRAGRLAIAAHVPLELRQRPDAIARLRAQPDPAAVLLAAARLDVEALWSALPEERLAALLGDEDPRVKEAAIARLQRHGTIASVPALTAAADAGGVVGRAARAAIVAIQERGGGSVGALSLAQDSPGALALTGGDSENGYRECEQAQ